MADGLVWISFLHCAVPMLYCAAGLQHDLSFHQINCFKVIKVRRKFGLWELNCDMRGWDLSGLNKYYKL